MGLLTPHMFAIGQFKAYRTMRINTLVHAWKCLTRSGLLWAIMLLVAFASARLRAGHMPVGESCP